MDKVEEAIESIWNSQRRGVYFPQEWKGKLALDEASAVQLGILERRLQGGEVQAGWKVGLTAKAMQIQQGVHEPVFGFLLRAGAQQSGTVFKFADLIRPGFENELCLTVGTTLQGPGVTLEMARAAISAVAPAIEVIEVRGDFAADLALALTDNAQQKAFVTGAATSPLPRDFDLSQTTLEVFVNGRSMERASGDAVMGTGPAASLAWLANKLATFGRKVEAGMRVMSGSFTKQYTLHPGDRVDVRFTPFGVVSAAFE